MEAGRAVQLLADNQVKLLAAQNTASQNSTNSNSSGTNAVNCVCEEVTSTRRIMKIIEDCWDDISTFNCQYGAHIFEGSRAKIYVNHWLSVSREIYKSFYRKNNEGFVGNCLLVFDDVKSFDFSITLHGVQDGKIRLHEPIVLRYQCLTEGPTTKYEFEGSLHGFPSSVSIAIEAKRFALHVYDKDEPAREA